MLLKHSRFWLGASFLAALTLTSLASAVGTRRWVLERGDDFKGGDLKGVAVDSGGRVRAGFDLGRVPIEGESVVLCALPRGDGSILLGTANSGHLLGYKAGQITTLADSGELAITSLVQGWGTAVYAATLPHGKIFKWDRDKWTEFVSLPSVEHVWQLAFSAKHGLYAATGPDGKLFHIAQDGHADVVFDAEEAHLMSAAIMPDGSVIAGASDKAILYRITGPGRSQVLYDFGRTEVRAIAASANGDIYAIANDIKTSNAALSKAKSGEAPAAPATNAAKVKGKGVLLHVDRNGVPEVLLSEDDEHFVSLALGLDGQPYVGTGVEGRVYTVTSTHRQVLIADTEERQITALELLGKVPFIVASDPAVLHPIRGLGGPDAAWTSKVLDAGLRASFGKLDWQSTGALEFATRTGNTREPDDSWSSWSTPLRQPGHITSPAGRYLQVRAHFNGGTLTELSRVEAYFITDNQRAVVTRIDATSAGSERSLSEGIASSGGPISARGNSDINLEWQVDNPDRDTLRYRIQYQLSGTATWYDLLDPNEVLTKTNYKWETANFPEGRYRVQVEASDELSNPPARTTRHSLQSGEIVLDSTPPAIDGIALAGRRLKLRAVDGTSPVQRLEISVVGTPTWYPLDCVDGVWDERNEAVDADLSAIVPPGRHLLSLRLYDAAGNNVVRSVEAF